MMVKYAPLLGLGPGFVALPVLLFQFWEYHDDTSALASLQSSFTCSCLFCGAPPRLGRTTLLLTLTVCDCLLLCQASLAAVAVVSQSGLSQSLLVHPDRCVVCAVRQRLQLPRPPLLQGRRSHWWLTLGPKALRLGQTPRQLGLAAAGRHRRQRPTVLHLHGAGLLGGSQVGRGGGSRNLLSICLDSMFIFEAHCFAPHRLFLTLLTTETFRKSVNV